MGQNPRRPGFRLRWGEADRSDDGESAATEAAVEQDAAAAETPDADATEEQAPEAAEAAGAPDAATEAVASEAATPAAGKTEEQDETPFLRDLVGAMRGVAESSRDSSLEGVRQAVDQRVAELTTTAAERTEELRRSADLDVNGIGEWERTEIERVRREAEQRREARRALLEQQLADHQGATDREVEATRSRLADHERELDAFFAQLSEITDPGVFVATAKRMPAPPDLSKLATAEKPSAAAATTTPTAEEKSATGEEKSATNGSGAAAPSDESLAARLAQLNQRLAPGPQSDTTTTAASDQTASPETTEAAPAPAAAPTAPAVAAPPAPVAGGAATAVETSTAIVVKGLGSFGAITSFKQALERVDGVRGVTLSLGPTGDFVYRASHAAEFDILGAIRSIEGPNTGIEQTDGSLVVTIARPR